MIQQETLLLTRSDVSGLIGLNDCIVAVERAFRLYGEGKILPPRVMGVHTFNGGFHIKAALYHDGHPYFATKINANFPANMEHYGLPAIQGVIILCDGVHGYPLAIMDSIEITLQRTAAASAIAARYLSRPNSHTVTICGCGNQGRVQLQALREVRPILKAFAYDIDEQRARAFAAHFSKDLPVTPVSSGELPTSLRKSDICVTCTPSREPFLNAGDIKPGTFIAAVGADSESKWELKPDLFVSTTVVVDNLEQCSTIGDLHHALEAGVITREDVHAELGQVIAGRKPGRTSPEEIIVFDSTGMALQDAAAALLVFERANLYKAGTRLAFA